MTQPLLAFIGTRVLLVGIGYAVMTVFPVHTVDASHGQAFPHNNWLDGWVRWDSMLYEAIVNSRPRFVREYLATANFFPMYSWVSWVVSLPLRAVVEKEAAFYLAALFVSSASFCAGLIATHRIAAMIASPSVATRTVWLIALFPFSFFFTAVYADAFYFCLAAWSLYFALLGRWWPACLIAAMAAMTRIPGAALAPALAIEYARQRGFNLRAVRANAEPFALFAIPPVLLGAYFLWRYGDPLAFLHARQEIWDRANGLTAFSRDFDYYFAGSVFGCSSLADCVREFEPTRTLLGFWYLGLLPLSASLVIYARRTLGAGLVAWALLSIGMSLPNGLDGMGRFTAVLFPVFISMAMVLRARAAFLAACGFFLPFLVLFFAQFARWRPVL